MPALTPTQIRTLAFLTAGYSSETKNKASYNLGLSWSGSVSNPGNPIGKSGYSVGTLQTDFGQQTVHVADFVRAYQAWAGNDSSRMVSGGLAGLTATLSSDGIALNANRSLLFSSTDVSKLNAFLNSTMGRTAVWSLDMKQLDTMQIAAQKLMQTPGYQGFVDDDDKALVLSVYMKLVNQTGENGLAKNILKLLQSGEVSWNEIQDMVYSKIPKNEKDYYQTGFDGTKAGALLFAKIKNSDTALAGWLNDLSEQDLNALGPLGFANDSRNQVLERLFRDTKQGAAFVDNLEAGKPMVMQLPSSMNGQAQTIGIDKDGEMFSIGKAGTFRHINGEWVPALNGDEQGQGLFLRPSKDGKRLLLASLDNDDGGIPLANIEDSALAQININGENVTLDGNSGLKYAFAADSSLIAVSDQNISDVSIAYLTGEQKGDSLRVQNNGSIFAFLQAGGYSLGLAQSDDLTQNLAYTVTRTSGATGQQTSTQIEPIKEDGVIVGQREVTRKTLNGVATEITTERKPVTDFDGNRVGTSSTSTTIVNGVTTAKVETTTTTDPLTNATSTETNTTSYGTNGQPSGSAMTYETRDATGQLTYQVRETYDTSGQITKTEDTQRQANGDLLTSIRSASGQVTATRLTSTGDDGSQVVTDKDLLTGVVTQTTYNAPPNGAPEGAVGTVFSTSTSTPVLNPTTNIVVGNRTEVVQNGITVRVVQTDALSGNTSTTTTSGTTSKTIVTNAQNVPISQQDVTSYDDGTKLKITTDLKTGRQTFVAVGADGTESEPTYGLSAQATAAMQDTAYGDAAALINAIHSGNKLSTVLYAAKLVTDFAAMNGADAADFGKFLNGVGAGIGVLSSLKGSAQPNIWGLTPKAKGAKTNANHGAKGSDPNWLGGVRSGYSCKPMSAGLAGYGACKAANDMTYKLTA